ncbi:MAG: FlgD immunoglobulin-like domain containing protein [bacterium]
MKNRYHFVLAITILALHFTPAIYQAVAQTPVNTANPILFVTQVPIPSDFITVNAVFGNHQPAMQNAGRGGDLYIRYPDGTLKNLTAAAGYGETGQQGAKAIAVREPSVHWSGTKAVFSMAIGAPQRYKYLEYYWQIYEITGLGKNETPAITKVPNQPANYNNVSPMYGSDDRIIFTSDRPRNGKRHLYPQLDEYETMPTNTGLWSLHPQSGDLFMLNHSPSGVFTPILDSFGRVVFTRWDHLQRDQQADADAMGSRDFGTFNYSSEEENSVALNNRDEVFPEPRAARTDLLAGTNLNGHSFNFFFPWQINEDGTEEETLNHIGRHELHNYFNRSLKDDSNLREFNPPATRTNKNSIENFLQIKEDPARPGVYFGIDAPEFYTHAAGQVISIAGALTMNADDMTIGYITHRETHSYTDNPSPNHSGLYRNPLPLANNMLVAVHTNETRLDRNDGSRQSPISRYKFRLKMLKKVGDYWAADQPLTPGISKTISYYDPDELVTYSGELWELDPVEVRPRPRPARRAPVLDTPEQQVLAEEKIDLSRLIAYMRQNNLALVVSRNMTTRDKNDRQQPFNLRVLGTTTQTTGAAGKIYDVAHLQFFQADQIRGWGGTASPRPGRRVLAQPLHDPKINNPPNPSGPKGSVKIASDGSMAAFVPARRAMTWQLTEANGTGVVRERYWITFQPGEIRTCTSCHGLNKQDQASRATPANKPEALRQLLRFYKNTTSVNGASSAASALPKAFQLFANQPNPFTTSTKIRLVMKENLNDARLMVYDMTGRQIWSQTLGSLTAGSHEIVWDGRNTAGQSVVAGTYLYRVEHRAGRSEAKTLTVVR